jgi:hypothetical protein
MTDDAPPPAPPPSPRADGTGGVGTPVDGPSVTGLIGPLHLHGMVVVADDLLWFVPSGQLITGPPDAPWCLRRSDVAALRSVRNGPSGHIQTWNRTFQRWDNVFTGMAEERLRRQLIAHGWTVSSTPWWRFRRRQKPPPPQ